MKKECQSHWQQLGIKDEETLKHHIDEIFEKHDHQTDVINDLYALIFPDWQEITAVHGHPEAGEELWKFICRSFCKFDKQHHPKVLPAGAWLNWGFSCNKELPPWDVCFDNCSVDY